MTHKLVLTLTGEHLALEVLKSAPAHRFHGLLGQLARFRQPAPAPLPSERVARVDVSESMTAASLPAVLESALISLKTMYAPSVNGLNLEVHLGLSHTRLGLLFLADANTSSVTASVGDAYTKAWVGQMWNVDPATQVIRWQVLGNKQKLLISCVDRQVFDGLDAFSRQHGLRFASCKPALLTALNNHEQQIEASNTSTMGAATLVWTEASSTARRSGLVQLLRYEGAQLQALWRGWLTPPESMEGPDDALEGAIRRFMACHQARPGDFLRHQHWPVLVPASRALEHAR